MPALLLLLVVVALVAWLTATFTERASLRGDLLAATAYVANWRFISTSSYFVATGLESPLQHTWTLAIEEQFYLLWPLVLTTMLVFVGRGRRVLVGVLAAGGVVVSATLLVTLWAPDGVERAYMGTDARIFEPLLGALGAVLIAGPRARSRIDRFGAPIMGVGIIMLVLALAVTRPESSVYYRGGAFAVSLATLMVVAPLWIGHGGPIRRALGWAPVVWLGVISYGVYLWHWPMTIWLGAREARGWEAAIRAIAVVVLTIGAAALSYYAVERPIRRGFRVRHHLGARHAARPRWVLAVVPIAMLAVAGISLAATDIPPPAPGTPVVMLAGDSVPLHLGAAMDREAEERGWRVVSTAFGSCPVTGEVVANRAGEPVHRSTGCETTIVDAQTEAIDDADPDVVIWWDRWSISSFFTAAGEYVRSGSPRFWDLRRRTLARDAQRLAAGGATVVFVATEPPGRAVLDRCTNDRCEEWIGFQIEHYDDITARWNATLRRYAELHPDHAVFMSITGSICRTDQAPCDDSIDGVTARPDGTHYEGDGQDMIVGALASQIAALLGAGRS